MDIEVEALPLIDITNNTGSTELTCTLPDISLTATGGNSYSWDNGLGSSSDVKILAHREHIRLLGLVC